MKELRKQQNYLEYPRIVITHMKIKKRIKEIIERMELTEEIREIWQLNEKRYEAPR